MKGTSGQPLYSLLLALNQTRVDYELYVLKIIPFDKVDIRMMAVEFAHDKGGDKSMRTFFNSKGFGSLIKVQRWDGKANDIIARKRGLCYVILGTKSLSHRIRKPIICICENKGAVTAMLTSAFIFATRTVQFLYFLNT